MKKKELCSSREKTCPLRNDYLCNEACAWYREWWDVDDESFTPFYGCAIVEIADHLEDISFGD